MEGTSRAHMRDVVEVLQAEERDEARLLSTLDALRREWPPAPSDAPPPGHADATAATQVCADWVKCGLLSGLLAALRWASSTAAVEARVAPPLCAQLLAVVRTLADADTPQSVRNLLASGLEGAPALLSRAAARTAAAREVLLKLASSDRALSAAGGTLARAMAAEPVLRHYCEAIDSGDEDVASGVIDVLFRLWQRVGEAMRAAVVDARAGLLPALLRRLSRRNARIDATLSHLLVVVAHGRRDALLQLAHPELSVVSRLSEVLLRRLRAPSAAGATPGASTLTTSVTSSVTASGGSLGTSGVTTSDASEAAADASSDGDTAAAPSVPGAAAQPPRLLDADDSLVCDALLALLHDLAQTCCRAADTSPRLMSLKRSLQGEAGAQLQRAVAAALAADPMGACYSVRVMRALVEGLSAQAGVELAVRCADELVRAVGEACAAGDSAGDSAAAGDSDDRLRAPHAVIDHSLSMLYVLIRADARACDAFARHPRVMGRLAALPADPTRRDADVRKLRLKGLRVALLLLLRSAPETITKAAIKGGLIAALTRLVDSRLGRRRTGDAAADDGAASDDADVLEDGAAGTPTIVSSEEMTLALECLWVVCVDDMRACRCVARGVAEVVPAVLAGGTVHASVDACRAAALLVCTFARMSEDNEHFATVVDNVANAVMRVHWRRPEHALPPARAASPPDSASLAAGAAAHDAMERPDMSSHDGRRVLTLQHCAVWVGSLAAQAGELLQRVSHEADGAAEAAGADVHSALGTEVTIGGGAVSRKRLPWWWEARPRKLREDVYRSCLECASASVVAAAALVNEGALAALVGVPVEHRDFVAPTLAVVASTVLGASSGALDRPQAPPPPLVAQRSDDAEVQRRPARVGDTASAARTAVAEWFSSIPEIDDPSQQNLAACVWLPALVKLARRTVRVGEVLGTAAALVRHCPAEHLPALASAIAVENGLMHVVVREVKQLGTDHTVVDRHVEAAAWCLLLVLRRFTAETHVDVPSVFPGAELVHDLGVTLIAYVQHRIKWRRPAVLPLLRSCLEFWPKAFGQHALVRAVEAAGSVDRATTPSQHQPGASFAALETQTLLVLDRLGSLCCAVERLGPAYASVAERRTTSGFAPQFRTAIEEASRIIFACVATGHPVSKAATGGDGGPVTSASRLRSIAHVRNLLRVVGGLANLLISIRRHGGPIAIPVDAFSGLVGIFNRLAQLSPLKSDPELFDASHLTGVGQNVLTLLMGDALPDPVLFCSWAMVRRLAGFIVDCVMECDPKTHFLVYDFIPDNTSLHKAGTIDGPARFVDAGSRAGRNLTVEQIVEDLRKRSQLAAKGIGSDRFREVLVVDLDDQGGLHDERLSTLISRAEALRGGAFTEMERIERLRLLTMEAMGGSVTLSDVVQSIRERSARDIHDAIEEFGGPVLPLGRITIGVCRHRALLFKVLADAAHVPATLVRGQLYEDEGSPEGRQKHAWNVVRTSKRDTRGRYQCYIVDLMIDSAIDAGLYIDGPEDERSSLYKRFGTAGVLKYGGTGMTVVSGDIRSHDDIELPSGKPMLIDSGAFSSVYAASHKVAYCHDMVQEVQLRKRSWRPSRSAVMRGSHEANIARVLCELRESSKECFAVKHIVSSTPAKEGTILAEMRHRHIVRLRGAFSAPPIYGWGRASAASASEQWLVFDRAVASLYSMATLLTPIEKVFVMIDVACALLHLHGYRSPRARKKHRSVHKDVKPHNVLITKDGLAVVCDFNVSSIVCAEGTISGEVRAAGTRPWAAPEMLRAMDGRGAAGTSEHKVDVWGFGQVLAYCFMLVPPSKEGEPWARQQLQAVGVPEAVCDVYALCTRADPRERPDFEVLLPLLWRAAQRMLLAPP